ncbi:MAG TPA: IPT/TIG domain-containing protein [Terriglobales bacterium]|nr:IPT/TIG domain-containing protein [Terriglobales bacterium]
MKILSVVLLALCTFGCGYSSKTGTPAPQPGVVPNITQLAPDNANSGSATFTLTVNGSNFASNAAIKFGASSMTTTFVSGNQLTAQVPATAVAAPGTVPVTVTNPATPAMGGPYGSGGTTAETSNSMDFTVN